MHHHRHNGCGCLFPIVAAVLVLMAVGAAHGALGIAIGVFLALLLAPGIMKGLGSSTRRSKGGH